MTSNQLAPVVWDAARRLTLVEVGRRVVLDPSACSIYPALLAAIKSAATTLIDYRQRLPDDRIEGFLHSIDAQTDHLNALLDDLVLLTKIEAGTLRLQPEPIALRSVIEQAIAQRPTFQ